MCYKLVTKTCIRLFVLYACDCNKPNLIHTISSDTHNSISMV